MNPSFAEALRSDAVVVAAELRPPRASLGRSAGMDAWIDTYHAVRTLARRGTYVILTDSAVGMQEEDNLRHLVANLGRDVPRAQVVPVLTAKHSLDYCLRYADRAVEHGFLAVPVLGGDPSVGTPRCVAHGWQLRRLLAARQPGLALGGWVNPHREAARQVEFMGTPAFHASFALTQVVSHHDSPAIDALLASARGRVTLPLAWGVFYYRSANARTLETLGQFLPVPADGLRREFAAGASPVDVCARTVRALLDRGVRQFYVSNLPLAAAQPTLRAILTQAGV
jgi:hypothetical protein